MAESTLSTGAAPWARGRDISTGALLGQVSVLVALALAFAAMGGFIGRDLAYGTARILSFVGVGMTFVASFGGPASAAVRSRWAGCSTRCCWRPGSSSRSSTSSSRC